MFVNPPPRPAMPVSAPALHIAAPVSPGSPGHQRPIMPAGGASNAGPGRGATLADRPAGRTKGHDADDAELAPRPAPEGDSHGPVLALMRQAAVFCRIANGPGQVGEGGMPSVAPTQAGLTIRGNLLVQDEAGLRIGSGQIYHSGELIAAFSGTNLAFIGAGRVSARL